MKKVYIAHPVGVTNWEENLHKIAAICAVILMKQPGVIPFAPYVPFCMGLNDKIGEERAAGIAATLELMQCCSELWVFGDFISPGMEIEIKEAKRLGLLVVNCSKKITDIQIEQVV